MHEIERRAGERRGEHTTTRGRIVDQGLHWSLHERCAPGPRVHAQRRLRERDHLFAVARDFGRGRAAGLGRFETEQGDRMARREQAQLLQRTLLVAAHRMAGKAIGHEQDAHQAPILPVPRTDVD